MISMETELKRLIDKLLEDTLNEQEFNWLNVFMLFQQTALGMLNT